MRNIIVALLARLLPLLVVVVLARSTSAASPKFQVLHAFAGGATDGSYPVPNLLLDRYGNLFGTTEEGGSLTDCYSLGCGTAFELSVRNGHWKENVLFDFSPTASGGLPNVAGTLVLDSIGNVYGTQNAGGDPSCNCGSVYKLTRSGGVWTQTLLHNFTGGTTDGAYPYWGLVEDAAGNLYGATQSGGINTNYGTIFELTPNADGTWTYSLIYEFGTPGYTDAISPYGPLTIDASGTLYGAAISGGIYGYGAVFKLSQSGGSWAESVLFNFTLDYGATDYPNGLVVDAAGNLYGTTTSGGAYGVGTIYKLTPSVGFWNRTVLHTFTGGIDGAYPYGGLAIDASGVLYGTTYLGGSYGYGNVYKFQSVDGKWKQTLLHTFTNGKDGGRPVAGPILDQLGNVYGVAINGGAYGFGVAFEITP